MSSSSFQGNENELDNGKSDTSVLSQGSSATPSSYLERLLLEMNDLQSEVVNLHNTLKAENEQIRTDIHEFCLIGESNPTTSANETESENC